MKLLARVLPRKCQTVLIVGAVSFAALLIPLIEVERARYVELFSGRGKTVYKLFGVSFWTKAGARWPEPAPDTVSPTAADTWLFAGSTGRTIFGQGKIKCSDAGKLALDHQHLEQTLLEWQADPREIGRARIELAARWMAFGPFFLEADYDNKALWAQPRGGDSSESRFQLWTLPENP